MVRLGWLGKVGYMHILGLGMPTIELRPNFSIFANSDRQTDRQTHRTISREAPPLKTEKRGGQDQKVIQNQKTTQQILKGSAKKKGYF